MIDVSRLADWMDGAALPGKGEPVQARFLSGGTQNEIYEIRRGEETCVIRIPPPGAPADRDKGILREWRIIEALDGTDVPHTRAVAVCSDASVLGRPFYLMGFVDGWSPMDDKRWPAPFDTDLDARQGLAYQLAEGIALLSKVDWQAKGLTDLGRPDGFHERQVERWTGFFDRIKGRELAGIDIATAWLAAHRPLDFIPGLMHGDYQFANVMYLRRGARAAGRHRRLGDGHRRRPEARPRAGWCRAGPRTPKPPRRPRRVTSTCAECRRARRWSRTTRRCPAVRSMTSTTTWCWRNGSWPSFSNRVSARR